MSTRPVMTDQTRSIAAVGVPDTVRLVRESRGLKVKDLADLLGKTPGYVSKVELGQLTLTEPVLTATARALDVPVDLLSQVIPAQQDEGVHFRSQNRTPQWVRRKVIADANWLGFTLNCLLGQMDAEFPHVLPDFDVDQLEDGPVEAAQLLRRLWRLVGPVRDLAGLLESAGVFILPMAPDVQTIDAITVRTPGTATAVILLREDVPEDRKRHTLAHELGHLVLDVHSKPVSMRDLEQRADAFAGEFLAPYDELRDELVGLTPSKLDHLVTLQQYWGVSVPALVRRAYLAGQLTEVQYRYWFRVLNARNMLRGAQLSTYPVRPRAATDVFAALRAEGYSPTEITDLCLRYLGDLQNAFGSQWAFPRVGRQLTSVPQLP